MSFSFDLREAPIHLLLTSIPATGHINPLVQLAHYLVKPRPWKPVTYVTLAVLMNGNTEGKIHLPTNERIRVIQKSLEGSEAWFMRYAETSEATAEEMTPRVCGLHNNWPPVKAVVFDFVSTFGQKIAERLNVPCFTYMASPLHFLWSFVQYDTMEALRKQENPPKTYSIPGIGDFKLIKPERDLSNPTHKMFLEVCKECIEAYQKAKGCLANDIQSFYSDEFWASMPPSPLPKKWEILCCGPLSLNDPRADLVPNDSGLREVELFVGRFPPRSVIFIALGSCWSLKNQDLVELVRGVAATGKPFVFAHRGQKKDDPFRKFLPEDTPANEETEEDGLPIGFREEISDRGMIVSWVNQPYVLTLPNIGAFMTHCGWNSIMEGIAYGGVPFLLLPIGGDQQANADFLDLHLKCGRPVREYGNNEPLDREKICRVIEEVFVDDELKSQSRRLHDLVHQESTDRGISEQNAIKFFHMVEELSK